VPVGEVACMLYVHLVYFGAKLRHKEKARNCMVWSWFGPTTCKIDFTLEVFVWNNGKKRFSRKFALPSYSLLARLAVEQATVFKPSMSWMCGMSQSGKQVLS
jgi:hypothetical protein